MSKDKTTDMSINPDDIKKSTAETNAQGKKVKVKKERKDPIKYPSHHKGHGKVSNKVHMKRGTEVKRVNRTESESHASKGWEFAKKSEYRAYLGGQLKTAASEPEATKGTTKKSSNS
jgi:hypothetical protein